MYSLRGWDAPLEKIIDRVGKAGFDGVEFAHRIRDAAPLPVADALDANDLKAVGAHVELSVLESEFWELLERYRTIGCDRIVLPHIPHRHFRTRDRIERLTQRLHDLSERLGDHGFELAYHNTQHNLYPTLDAYGLHRLLDIDVLPGGAWNHVSNALGWAFCSDSSDIARQTGYGHLLETTDESKLSLEVDVKNVVAAGYSPESLFDVVGERASLVHIADIDRSRLFPPQFESVDPGTGLVGLEESIEAAIRSPADWVIFEHDNPSHPETALHQGIETLSPHFSTL